MKILGIMLFAATVLGVIGCDEPVGLPVKDAVIEAVPEEEPTEDQALGTMNQPVTAPTVPEVPAQQMEEDTFNAEVLPILTARCAFAGCHVAGGPNNIDLSSYQSFRNGGADGPIYIPGNARSSDIVEEIVAGRMPPGGPPLAEDQIQRIVDWINAAMPNEGAQPAHGDDDDDDRHDDDDEDEDEDDEDEDEDDEDDDDDDNDDDDDDDDDD